MKGEWSGKTIGGYRLAEEIGRGCASVVYRAYQLQLERWVAIKILQANIETRSKKFRRLFRREAQAIAALRHPNISTIYDYGEEAGLAYIVMEYVPSGSLKKYITAEPVPSSEALDIIIPVGSALAYAHTQNIVHRNVKPANILLPRPDWPLLTDFGLAGIDIMDRTTRSDQMAYLSPEQVMSKPVDHRADIYSLGVVLFELVTGHMPFQVKSSSDSAPSITQRMYDNPQSPRHFNPDLSLSLEDVIMRALERNPDARYGSMEDFVMDLRQVRAHIKPGKDLLEDDSTISTMITTRMVGAKEEVAGPQLFIATSGIALPIPSGEEVVIGRRVPTQAEPPDLDLDPYGGMSAGMSRYHARLLRQSDGWYIEDMQSTNGTYVNEVRLLPHRPMRVRSGDLIRFGQLTVVFNEG
jgi:serine/threonine protein kinase